MNMFLRDTPGRTCIQREDFFSVAIISFNRFHRLKHLIDTIHKHADMPFEICVSDDGGALYDDFNFIKDYKDKISHIAVNMGLNKGMHVNANNAISLTRSKYVAVLTDDMEITRPFMRSSVNILKHAPYVGTIHLQDNTRGGVDCNFVCCKTPTGEKYGVGVYPGAASCVFRKDYWYEVGGFSEDDMYGDLPFGNKGWLRGYFTAFMEGGIFARDTDKTPAGHTSDSSGKSITNGYTNYPKLFRVPEAKLRAWGMDRQNQCSQRNIQGRKVDFNEFQMDGWSEYQRDSVIDGQVNWILLEAKYHKRFIEQLKLDALPVQR